MTALVSSASGMEGDMPVLLEDSIVQQGLPDGFGHEDFAAMVMQTWAVAVGGGSARGSECGGWRCN
jgi:hypothetical protein